MRAALGNASLGLKRSDLITKVEGGLAAAETAKRLAADVSLLGLVLLHFPKAAPFKSMEETVQEQWRAIVDFVQPGGARGAGVSQFCQECLGYLDGAGASPASPPGPAPVRLARRRGNRPAGHRAEGVT